MHLPTLEGLIRRRILVNFRIDLEVARTLVPEPLELDVHGGWAHAGICLIRLEQIRPTCSPIEIGIASENVAHRFAVTRPGEPPQSGVFVPRRDTDNLLNRIAGGRLFPGRHGRARFVVDDALRDGGDLALSIHGEDGLAITVRGRPTKAWPSTSVFEALDQASAFYSRGVRGWSPNGRGELEAVDLCISQWRCTAFELDALHSSYFADTERFPAGSVEFDHALFMQDIQHEWHAVS
ncbi:MAG TPA: DUF2071 domain-containing protein [Enhygromyxa sp.]|nr:DUF2071 domain-containing protein [Enhygromyxa sp.]